MAYFPNGTSGEVLERQCDDCPLGYGWNDPDQKELFDFGRIPKPCPVAFVQLEYNYKQIVGRGCGSAADFLETQDPPPKFIEKDGNVSFGSSESQLKVAVEHLRSTDMVDLMNVLIDEKGECQVRKLLVEVRGEAQ